MNTTTNTVVQIHKVYIKATAQAIWTAITDPEWTARYGYQVRTEYELRPGGTVTGYASQAMKDQGTPDVMVEGEILESDPPHKLVMTWNPVWIDEPATRLTYEIEEDENGVTSLTVTQDVTDAPATADQMAGRLENAGGGWPQVLSDLKSLLETGKSLYA